MKLKIKTLERGDKEVEIDEDAPLSVLRALIEDQTGVPSARQRLIFQGRPLLVNERTLNEYGVADGLTLHMVERPANAPSLPMGGNGDERQRESEGGHGRGEQQARMNVINGEMALSRTSIFQEPNAVLGVVRAALMRSLSSLRNSTTSEIELQEDVPHVGDLSLQVRIRGNAMRRADSGARERISRASELIQRTRTLMGVLDEGIVPYVTALERGESLPDEPSLLVQLDATILRLEEVYMQPSDTITPADMMETDNDVPPDSYTTESAAHSANRWSFYGPAGAGHTNATASSSGDSTTPPTYTVAHSTGSDYASVLDQLMVMQQDANAHMRRYMAFVGSTALPLLSHESEYALVVYQEQVQRVLHRLSHIYHSLSDISLDMTSAAPASIHLAPLQSHFHNVAGTEVVLSLTFSSAHDSPVHGPLPTSRHELIDVTQSPSNPVQSASTLLRTRDGPSMHRTPSGVSGAAHERSAHNSGTHQGTFTVPQGSFGVRPGAGLRMHGTSMPFPRPPAPPVFDRAGGSLIGPHFFPAGVIPFPTQGPPMHMAPAPIHFTQSTAQWSPNGQPRAHAHIHTTTPVDLRTLETQTGNGNPNSGSNVDGGGASAGLPQRLRNMFESTFGTMWASNAQHSAATPAEPSNAGGTAASEGGATNTAQGAAATTPQQSHAQMHAQAHSLAHAHAMGQQMGGPGQLHAFRAPFGHALMGQVIVHSNGPANAEATRRAVDAAVQAANTAVTNGMAQARGNMHLHASAGAPIRGDSRNREPLSWIRRDYANTTRDNQDAEPPTGMFVGPSFPQDAPIYTTDPYLPCQSPLGNPRASVRNSPRYQTTLSTIREAVVEHNSRQNGARPSRTADSITERWARVWGSNDGSERRIVVNQRGEASFESTAHFASVIENMMRRAISNMADTDSDVARDLTANTGEFGAFNYSITPIVNSPIRTIGLPIPMMGTIELESISADIEIESTNEAPVNASMSTNTGSSSSQTARTAFRTSTAALHAQPPPPTTNQPTPQQTTTNNGGSQEDVMGMVRAVFEVMQSGRRVTLAEVMQELEQTDNAQQTGFISVVRMMVYELLQVLELVQLFTGNFSVIQNNRLAIRRFVIEHILNDNSRPSQQDIASASERVGLTESDLDQFLTHDDTHRFVEVEGVGRVDLMATVLGIDRRAVIAFLTTVLSRDQETEADDYSRGLVDLFRGYIRRIALIANLGMTGAPFDYETLLLRAMNGPSSEMESQMVQLLSQILPQVRELLFGGTPFTVADMGTDFVLAPPHAEPIPTTPSENTASPSTAVASENSVEPTTTPAPSHSTEREVVESSSNAPNESANIADNAKETVEDTRWKAALPQEWVPIIVADIPRMAAMPAQAPYSDAYLCGSSMTRKLEKETEGCETRDDLMADSVNTAFTNALAQAPHPAPVEVLRGDHRFELSEAAREDVDEAVERRVERDPDFESDKFPELSKFLSNRKGS